MLTFRVRYIQSGIMIDFQAVIMLFTMLWLSTEEIQTLNTASLPVSKDYSDWNSKGMKKKTDLNRKQGYVNWAFWDNTTETASFLYRAEQ